MLKEFHVYELNRIIIVIIKSTIIYPQSKSIRLVNPIEVNKLKLSL